MPAFAVAGLLALLKAMPLLYTPRWEDDCSRMKDSNIVGSIFSNNSSCPTLSSISLKVTIAFGIPSGSQVLQSQSDRVGPLSDFLALTLNALLTRADVSNVTSLSISVGPEDKDRHSFEPVNRPAVDHLLHFSNIEALKISHIHFGGLMQRFKNNIPFPHLRTFTFFNDHKNSRWGRKRTSGVPIKLDDGYEWQSCKGRQSENLELLSLGEDINELDARMLDELSGLVIR
ncbi:hypothetical protein CPB83DRAFT_839063 [Crepidotus variabilis]|uniref:Uncharacterized protein n=1 Tax=Crepidotus variabilis TaxID=179855 RepID=A0A9P6E854_9AGAR|nr:hypothetical protein CPB83DRAFT_839063 [Crepidotus variabilis]